MKNRAANVKWHGNLKEGGGKITTESGTITDLQFSFSTRFENKPGTNPEELIAAAHAACFSMALSGELQKMHYIADEINTTATVKIEKPSEGAWKITHIHLKVEAIVPGCDRTQFERAAENTKVTCPVSQLLKAEISLEANLLSPPLQAIEAGPV